jgi:hypothetical protein
MGFGQHPPGQLFDPVADELAVGRQRVGWVSLAAQDGIAAIGNVREGVEQRTVQIEKHRFENHWAIPQEKGLHAGPLGQRMVPAPGKRSAAIIR